MMELNKINGQSASKVLTSNKEQEQSSTTILCCGEVPITINCINWEMVETKRDKIYIYCLMHPINNEIRYVGITIDLISRYKAHCYHKKQLTNWKVNWVNSLREQKLKPKMCILEEINESNFKNSQDWISFSDNRETFYIKELSNCGYKLVNHDKLLSFNNSYTSEGQHKNTKKVYEYDSETLNLIKEWDSLKQVINEKNVSYSALSCAISRKTKCVGNYWSLQKMNKYALKVNIDRGKKCYRYDLFGNFIDEFKSIAEASRVLKINRTCIKDAVNGIQKSAGKFIFKDFKTNIIISYDKIVEQNKYKNSHFS